MVLCLPPFFFDLIATLLQIISDLSCFIVWVIMSQTFLDDLILETIFKQLIQLYSNFFAFFYSAQLLLVFCFVNSFSCELSSHKVHHLQLHVFGFFLSNIRWYVCSQYLDLIRLNFYQIVRICYRKFLDRVLVKLIYLIKQKAEILNFYYVIQNYFN